jgi:protein-disulfide isomerase
MATSKNSGKLIIFALVALVGGAAGFGYFKQSAQLSATAKSDPLTAEQMAILTPKPSDIIIGDNNALTTIVEYSSLTCPHCAQFHTGVLPLLQKEFISTGKVKLVVRHFPLNEAAMRASQIVECAGQNNLKRENFLKVLFDMQAQWAFSEAYLQDIKKIALVGGIDSAAFDSCMSDKALETRVLTMRQEAQEKLEIKSTPSFFIDGQKLEDTPTIESFRKALESAARPSK